MKVYREDRLICSNLERRASHLLILGGNSQGRRLGRAITAATGFCRNSCQLPVVSRRPSGHGSPIFRVGSVERGVCDLADGAVTKVGVGNPTIAGRGQLLATGPTSKLSASGTQNHRTHSELAFLRVSCASVQRHAAD